MGTSALVLIIAYLGGYVFLIRPYPVRFRIRYLEGHRLLFEAGALALPFLFLSRLICHLLAHLLPRLYQAWHAVVPIDFLGTAVGAIGIAVLSAELVNWTVRRADARGWTRWNRLSWMVRILNLHGSALEKLLCDCFTRQKLLAINLKNSKVYIGYVVSLSDRFSSTFSAPLEYLDILPMWSGFRKGEERNLIFTTEYASAYQRFLDDKRMKQKPENPATIDPDDFRLVIRVSEIYTVSPFDFDFYRHVQPDPMSEEVSLPDTLRSIGKAVVDVQRLYDKYSRKSDPDTIDEDHP